MATKGNLILEFGEEVSEIELFWNAAPNICEQIWSHLPIESFVTPAKVCGNEIIFMLPFTVGRENLQIPKIGDVGWWDKRVCVNIWYGDPGPIGPLGPTALFGRVSDNLEGIARQAHKNWIDAGTRMVLKGKTV